MEVSEIIGVAFAGSAALAWAGWKLRRSQQMSPRIICQYIGSEKRRKLPLAVNSGPIIEVYRKKFRVINPQKAELKDVILIFGFEGGNSINRWGFFSEEKLGIEGPASVDMPSIEIHLPHLPARSELELFFEVLGPVQDLVHVELKAPEGQFLRFIDKRQLIVPYPVMMQEREAGS